MNRLIIEKFPNSNNNVDVSIMKCKKYKVQMAKSNHIERLNSTSPNLPILNYTEKIAL